MATWPTRPTMRDGSDRAQADAGRRTLAVLGRWLYPYALVALGTFLAGAAVGAVAMATTSPDALAGLGSTFGEPDLFPARLTTWTVFANNVVAMTVLAAGAVTFGVSTFVGLFFNGLLLGALVWVGTGESGLAWTLALVLPHGVVELGAFFVVSAVAYRVAWRVVGYLRGVDDRPVTRTEVVEAVALAVVSVLALALAAWIEATLTLDIARALVGEPAVPG